MLGRILANVRIALHFKWEETNLEAQSAGIVVTYTSQHLPEPGAFATRRIDKQLHANIAAATNYQRIRALTGSLCCF